MKITLQRFSDGCSEMAAVGDTLTNTYHLEGGSILPTFMGGVLNGSEPDVAKATFLIDKLTCKT